ncbi:MAG: hypothetical protein IPK71_02260 [Myxococcales bacterium]|nr:hypothetical protein [Myxococcales bacterium]
MASDRPPSSRSGAAPPTAAHAPAERLEGESDDGSTAATTVGGKRAWLPELTIVDVTLALSGMLFGAQSLFYPFGRDQATHGYIGREWLAGRLPFVSTFDIKTPGIFFVHMATFAIFGEHTWGLRVVDLFGCVLTTGFLVAYALTPPGERPRRGLVGFSVLAVNLLYYGPFDFWNSGQCESFCSVFSIAGMMVALRARPRDALVSGLAVGLFTSLAVLFKPPCLWNAIVVFAVFAAQLVRKAPSRDLRVRAITRAAAASAIGGALPPALVIGYFGAKGALPAMYDVLVVTSRQYVAGGSYADSFLQGLQLFSWGILNFNATLLVSMNALVVGAVLARRRGDRDTFFLYCACIGGLVAGFLTVVIQLKFFTYHWSAMLGFLVLAVTALAKGLCERLDAAGKTYGPKLAVAVLVLAYLTGTAQVARSLGLAKRALYYARTGDDEPLGEMWDVPGFYPWKDAKKTGLWLAQHAGADERVAVRGFEPQIYFFAKKRYDGRYFWTTFLTARRFSKNRDHLSREDFASFKVKPPKWVVALSYEHEGVDAAETYEALGYVRRVVEGHFVILEDVGKLDFGDEVRW